MAHYNLNVLGHDVSFKAETDPKRVEQARLLLEERYKRLRQHGTQISKEKLLTFLALALADDMLQAREEMERSEKKLRALLESLDNSGPGQAV
jgi:cell division protein ZapA